MNKYTFLLLILSLFACDKTDDSLPPEPQEPEVYRLPVVVHVLHRGEAVGEGTNLSMEGIQRQIEIINEDFRRKAGTRGFNSHPDSEDARIQFTLANLDPEGNPTLGVVRKELKLQELPDDLPNFEFERYAFFSYWNPAHYINIWVVSYADELTNVHLGMATGPDSDLPGDHLFQKPLPGGAEGIVINWAHFGESDIPGKHNLGRTLTHELGHYLGLLHTWGDRNCETNDFCEDTPAVSSEVSSSMPYLGCSGEEVMVANYMNYSPDAVMNVFTNDQISRMHHVLQNSPRRTSLLTSPGLLDFWN